MRVGQTIEQAERALIELTLEHTKNNKTRAAELLGISLKTLHNKLNLYRERGLLNNVSTDYTDFTLCNLWTNEFALTC